MNYIRMIELAVWKALRNGARIQKMALRRYAIGEMKIEISVSDLEHALKNMLEAGLIVEMKKGHGWLYFANSQAVIDVPTALVGRIS